MGTYKSVPEIRLSGNIRGTETIVTVKIWGLLLDITERNKSCRDSTKKWDERASKVRERLVRTNTSFGDSVIWPE